MVGRVSRPLPPLLVCVCVHSPAQTTCWGTTITIAAHGVLEQCPGTVHNDPGGGGGSLPLLRPWEQIRRETGGLGRAWAQGRGCQTLRVVSDGLCPSRPSGRPHGLGVQSSPCVVARGSFGSQADGGG